MKRSLFLASLCAFLVAACGTTMDVRDFSKQQPKLILEDYFSGRTQATGLFEDRFGNVRSQFVVDIDGRWDGETLTLEESFQYVDGETEFRLWEIRKTGLGTYVGTTENVIGQAKGEVAGNSFHWTYKFNLKVGDDIWKVKFDDWMFLQADGVLLNKATVYRWGIKIGTVFLSFKQMPQVASAGEVKAAE